MSGYREFCSWDGVWQYLWVVGFMLVHFLMGFLWGRHGWGVMR